jgi:H+-transporting ATPase
MMARVMAASAPGSTPFLARGGLSSVEAAERLVRFGPNVVAEERRRPLMVLVGKLWAPVPWMLEATVALEAALGKWVEAAVVAGLLCFNAALGLVQEGRAQAALRLLRQRLSVVARVHRDGRWQTLPAEQLVPGDLVHRRLGDVVPADVRLGEGGLLVDQSALTGESLPVELAVGALVYAGATVVRGGASGEVAATGAATYFGRTAELVRTARAQSHLEGVIVRIVRALVALDLALAVVVVGYELAAGAHAGRVLQFAAVLLLGSVPVALPATFTLAGALGALELAGRGVLVARLSAIEEAAGMDVLCVDKTGTITRNQLALADVRVYPPATRADVLRLAAEASDEATQDPIDLALLAAAANEGCRPRVRRRFLPFEPASKRSEALVEGDVRVVKGAPAAVAALTDGPTGLDGDVTALAAGGRRVLAVAEGGGEALRLTGLVALSDPPRPDSAALVHDLQALGVRLLMLTRDGLETASAVAAQVGIDGAACTAEELRAGTAGPLERLGVVAGVLPEDKYQVVRTLQQAGHVVGMTGDGVNDAPALKQAEVGIAVANATDVAKAAASLILTQPGLTDIIAAVQTSRRIYQRMLTYALNASIKKLEVPVFLSITLLTLGLFPLTPLLMVLLLFANDFATMAITTDRVGFSRQPDRWHVGQLLGGALAVALPLLALTFAAFALGRAGYSLGEQPLQTFVFVLLVASSQAGLYLVRERGPFWRNRPGRLLLAVSVADLAAVTTLALGGWLIAPISPLQLTSLLALVTCYALLLDPLKVHAFTRIGLRTHQPRL